MCPEKALITLPFVQHPSGGQKIVTAITRSETISAAQKAVGLWLTRACLPIGLRAVGHRIADDEPSIRHIVEPSDLLVHGDLGLLKVDVAGVARFIRLGGTLKAVEVAVQEPPPAAAEIAVYSLDPPNLLLTPDLHIDTSDGGMFTIVHRILGAKEAGLLERNREPLRLTISLYDEHDTRTDQTYPLNVVTADVA